MPAVNTLDTDDKPSGGAAYDRPSKTRLKQDSHALQDLGEALVELPENRLDGLAISEPLLDAVREYKRTRSHEGRRRQMQYIGKLMRKADPEPLREAVAAFKLPSAEETLKLHQAEAWREQLIADDAALTRWAADFPHSDLQQLRRLIRAARQVVLVTDSSKWGSTSLTRVAPLDEVDVLVTDAEGLTSTATVTITGSNIKRTDAETASPVQVITREDIVKTGKQSLAEVSVAENETLQQEINTLRAAIDEMEAARTERDAVLALWHAVFG